ncbi:hypothetical protein WISP_150512 [Willisornis vidua]|uniref:Uncharacterized protein n=1 Tax=Willisornis vidua TaxID=1566151 RepID=A0ABQ9CJQ6_9PASS|nr:hypothetical protein WISP_150512 [Willisornis vidua]
MPLVIYGREPLMVQSPVPNYLAVVARNSLQLEELFLELDAEKAKLKLERWASRDAGSGGGKGGDMESSGDCDDEDGCQGSGDRSHTADKHSFCAY